MRVIVFLLAAACLLLAGCASPVGSYQSFAVSGGVLESELLARARIFEGPERNPVVIIHGFLGAKLTDPGSESPIWGRFSARVPSDDQLRRFAHPMAEGKNFNELNSSSVASGILEEAEIRFAGFTFRQPGYGAAIDMLIKAGYVDADRPLPEGKHYPSLFTFAYDWRRDLPENAERLHRFLQERRRMLQQRYFELYGVENYDVRFDLMAHSMGGLLARYYLMYGDQDLPADPEQLPKLDWRGARIVDKAVLVGTPNDGYLDTFTELVGGLVLAPGAPRLAPGIIATFPSYYQMLPGPSGGKVYYAGDRSGEALDLFEPELWIQHNWGLADPANDPYLELMFAGTGKHSRAELRRIARDHLRKCLARARQFRRALDVPADPPKNCALFLYAGDAIETAERIGVDPVSGKLVNTDYGSGDGKVLLSSARFDRVPAAENVPPFSHSPVRWQGVYHVGAAHMGLFASTEFWHNVRYNLLMYPTRAQRERFGIE